MVTHCICHDLSFEELRRIALAERLGLCALKLRTNCCTGCGTCEPYVRLMLKTGRTRLPVLDARACRALMSEPAPTEASK